jgi:hypothetical protein
LIGRIPLPLAALVLRRLVMTFSEVGFELASWMPLIMRSTPSQDSYGETVGNWVGVKCWFFSSADFMCLVPSFGSKYGRNSVSKLSP